MDIGALFEPDGELVGGEILDRRTGRYEHAQRLLFRRQRERLLGLARRRIDLRAEAGDRRCGRACSRRGHRAGHGGGILPGGGIGRTSQGQRDSGGGRALHHTTPVDSGVRCRTGDAGDLLAFRAAKFRRTSIF